MRLRAEGRLHLPYYKKGCIEESGSEHPRCDYCGLPAVCFGSDLAAPRHRCPRCCRANRQFGGVHGPDDYLGGHAAAEGQYLYTGSDRSGGGR